MLTRNQIEDQMEQGIKQRQKAMEVEKIRENLKARGGDTMILLLQKGSLVLEASRIADALEHIETKVKENGASGEDFKIFSAKVIPFELETKAVRATVIEA